jgi:hypothetical protein
MRLEFVELAGFRGFREKVRVELPSGFQSRPEPTSKIPERVGLDHHCANAELVEQRPLREREIILAALLYREPDQVWL